MVNHRAEEAAAKIRALAPDGVDVVTEVALGTNLALDLAVLRPRGTVAAYANDGGRPVRLGVMRGMALNARFQFLILYPAGPGPRAAAVEDVSAALRDGALPIGEPHGLLMTGFPLARTAEAHRAVENATVGKVAVDTTPRQRALGCCARASP